MRKVSLMENNGPGEMALRLRTCSVLTEDLDWFPSAIVATYNSRSKGSGLLLCPQGHRMHMVHIYTIK